MEHTIIEADPHLRCQCSIHSVTNYAKPDDTHVDFLVYNIPAIAAPTAKVASPATARGPVSPSTRAPNAPNAPAPAPTSVAEPVAMAAAANSACSSTHSIIEG